MKHNKIRSNTIISTLLLLFLTFSLIFLIFGCTKNDKKTSDQIIQPDNLENEASNINNDTIAPELDLIIVEPDENIGVLDDLAIDESIPN
ncbi:MAG: hypothetical protein QXK76_02445 [Candidatus Woesearchaeota archaeon]